MTVVKKAPLPVQKTPTSPEPLSVQQEVDEIDSIMNEINELQQEIRQETVPPKTVAAVKSPAVAKAPPKLKSVSDTEMELLAAVNELKAEKAELEEDSHELQPEPSAESNLEETFAHLKNETDSEGSTLLDEVNYEEASTTSENANVTDDDFRDGVEEQLAERVQEEPADEEEFAMKESRPANQGKNTNEGSLTMTLSGTMTLKLRYAFGEQEVAIGFADGFLNVQLADGTEFKVPVGRVQNSARKRAA